MLEKNMISDLSETTIPRVMRTLDTHPPTRKRHVTGIGFSPLSITTQVENTSVEPKPNLLSQLHDLAAMTHKYAVGILITVDEIQSAHTEHLQELAVAIQDLNRDDAEIAFLAAGLPSGIDDLLQMDGTTFLRRAEKIHLSTLQEKVAQELFRDTANQGEKTFEDSALKLAAQNSYGYPYLIQVIGSISWAYAKIDNSDVINEDHVRSALPEAINRLGRQVHEPSLHGISQRQWDFLYAMAELCKTTDAPIALRDIAEKLGTDTTALSRPRQALIHREIISAHSRGYLEFCLPYMVEYLESI
ncbi:ATP-binding protein [Corynebacterium sp. sy039]|uniref:ATP-binding protein n=1 Tax=Corynebacterium sp. sy039 TaxID=2599641 RepID=UPI001FF00B0C|nr:ATP-binding protein [Corynebacterium sp. sy039]